MNSKKEDDIVKFIRGQLTKKELEDFEAKVKSSSSLTKKVRFTRNLMNILKEPYVASSGKTLLALRQEKLQKIQNKPEERKSTNSMVNFVKKKPVLFFLFLMTIILNLLVINNIIFLADCNSLYHKHLKSYPSIFNSSDATRPQLTATINAYKAGQFEEAVKGFDTYLDKDPIFRFYATISSLFIEPLDLARTRAEFTALRRVFEDDDAYRHFIEWIDYYEALLKFKEEDFKTGKSKIWLLHEREDMDADLKEIIDRFNSDLSWYVM